MVLKVQEQGANVSSALAGPLWCRTLQIASLKERMERGEITIARQEARERRESTVLLYNTCIEEN
jgi:hypothetical protein